MAVEEPKNPGFLKGFNGGLLVVGLACGLLGCSGRFSWFPVT
jgi:hypothetical protein